MDALYDLSSQYAKMSELTNVQSVTKEVEQIEKELKEAMDQAIVYLASRDSNSLRSVSGRSDRHRQIEANRKLDEVREKVTMKTKEIAMKKKALEEEYAQRQEVLRREELQQQEQLQAAERAACQGGTKGPVGVSASCPLVAFSMSIDPTAPK